MHARRASALALLGALVAAAWLAQSASSRAARRSAVLTSALRIPSPSPLPPPSPATRPTPRATVAFVGDIAVALGVAATLKKGPPAGFPFAGVTDRLRGYDLAVGNLECVVSSRGQVVVPEPLLAPLDTPKLLVDAGFGVVSVANNHTLDMSKEGFFEMLERLDAGGLGHFGTTVAAPARRAFIVRDVSGVRLALVGHVDRGKMRALRDIAEARAQADVVVVFAHWGVEYEVSPTRYQREMSRTLIDAGADAVIGAHAHVVQPAERHRGRLIAHGLGNFVFSGMTRPGSRTGALLELDLGAEGVVGHRFVRVAIDEQGAPRFVGEPSDGPPLEPLGPRVMAAMR